MLVLLNAGSLEIKILAQEGKLYNAIGGSLSLSTILFPLHLPKI
jgi:hypothetical protein